MSRVNEEYTLKSIRKLYNLRYMDKTMKEAVELNIESLESGIDIMCGHQGYSESLCADVLEAELKSYIRIYNKMKREHPEFFI